MYDEVDRQSGMTALGGAPSPMGHPRATVLTTQMCWLNRSIRTWADPGIVAEVASKPSVQLSTCPACCGLTALPCRVARRLPAEIRPDTTVTAPWAFERPRLDRPGIIVAVIDSEVAALHPSLVGRVVHRRNFTPNETWGNPARAWHRRGRHHRFRRRALPGVAPEAVIYNYKVLATNALLTPTISVARSLIQQALEDGAVVANCSWGAGPVGGGTSREARAVDAAWALGMLVVKSAGNRGPGAAR